MPTKTNYSWGICVANSCMPAFRFPLPVYNFAEKIAVSLILFSKFTFKKKKTTSLRIYLTLEVSTFSVIYIWAGLSSSSSDTYRTHIHQTHTYANGPYLCIEWRECNVIAHVTVRVQRTKTRKLMRLYISNHFLE